MSLVLQLDASVLPSITKDEVDRVSQQDDQAQSNNGVQAAGLSQPLWVNDGSEAGDRDIIRYGLGEFLNCGSHASLDFTDALTLALVVKRTGGVSWQNWVQKTDTNGSWSMGWGIGSDVSSDNIRFWVNGWNTCYVEVPMIGVTGSWTILIGTYNKALGSANAQFWVDNVSKGTDDYTTAINGQQYDVTVGADGNGNYGLDGDIGEIRVYDSAEDAGALYTVLNNKWGSPAVSDAVSAGSRSVGVGVRIGL